MTRKYVPRLFFNLAVAVVVLAGVVLFSYTQPLYATTTTFTVDSTLDTRDDDAGDGLCDDGNGNCTLRAAILETNATAGTNPIIIDFNIPGSGVHTFYPNDASNPPLDDITRMAVTIDGTTQPGSSCGDLWNSTAPAWNIVIDGNDAIDIGLGLHATNITIKGLAITGIIQHSAFAVGEDAPNAIAQCLHLYENPGSDILVDGDDALIGGATAGAGNVLVSGMTLRAADAVVQGNFIGTNVAGTTAVADGQAGISDQGTNSLIGGTSAGARNLISGYDDSTFSAGINLNGTGALVQGNYIGTTITGATALGNSVGIFANASNNTIGGTSAGAGNVISGNSLGILLADSGGALENILVQGNSIGVAANGTSALGNTNYGLLLINSGVANNTIGGTSAGAGNIIAHSTNAGIATYDFGSFGVPNTGVGNAILGNSIYSNGALGIDLSAATGPEGVTANDTGDSDTGPNNFQNYPVITTATTDGSTTVITGTLNSLASTSYRLEFFSNATADGSGYGEGKTFLGTTTVTTSGSGNASFTATGLTATTVGYSISATASQDLGSSHYSTSEFSLASTVAAPTLDHFSFATIGTQSAGTAFNVTITAKDVNNLNVPSFTGTVDLTTTSGSISPTQSGAFSSGARTQSVTVTASGSGKTITATDHAGTGKTGVSNAFTVNPDAVAPTVSMSAPTNNATVTGTITVSTNASDNIAVTSVQFFKDSDTSAFATDNSSPFSVTLNTTTLLNGTHTLRAKAYDAASNNTTSSNITVTVSNPPDSYTQGLWHLNETSGAFVDASSQGNNLGITGSPTYSQSGKFSTAVKFSTSGDYGEISDASQSGLDITGVLTIDAWINKTSASGTDTIVQKWTNGGSRSYKLTVTSAGAIVFDVYGSSAGTITSPSSSITAGQWQHVAAVYDGTYLRLFLDGVSVATPVSYSGGIQNGSAPFRLSDSGTGSFNGLLDEVRISNIARWTADFTPANASY